MPHLRHAAPLLALLGACAGCTTAPGHPPRLSDRGYGGLYTADAKCMDRDAGDYPTHVHQSFATTERDCGLLLPDLTNDHPLQAWARGSGELYVITVKGGDGLDHWALCRMGPRATVDRHPYRCQFLHVRSAPSDRAAVAATLPRRVATAYD